MFFLNGKQKIMVLARHQVALSLSATNPANLPELYFSMASRLDETAHRLNSQLRSVEVCGNQREEESLRLVLTFDANNRLSDQSGYYFPGLKGMMRTGHSLSGLAFQEEPKIEHMFLKEADSLQVKSSVETLFQTKQAVRLIVNTHRVEIIPLSGLATKEAPGFQLIIHRKEALTLSFLVAKTLASKGGKALSIQSEERRTLLEQLGSVNTLHKSVSLFKEYAQLVFGVSLDKISTYLQKDSSASTFDIDPDLMQSNVGEYFEQEQKRKRVIMKFQQAVHVKVLQKKGSGIHNATGPTSVESSLLKQPDLDFLDRDKAQTLRLCWLMFEDWDLPRNFNFTEDKFIPFLLEAQRLYDQHKNPFHNFAHGMTVLHQTYYMLRVTRLSKFFESIGRLAILFAGLMHDVDHRGRTNAFEQNSLSDIAIMHNDRSILENHHCSTAFQLVRQQKYNFLDKLTSEQYMDFRKVVIEAILATDVKRHFEIIDAFTKRLEDKDFSPTPDSPADHALLCGMVTHTCDLYVPTRKLQDAIKWSALVNKEFMEQNKEEKLKGLPEVPFYKNLDQPKILANSEKFFVEKIVSPLWKQLNTFLEGKLKSHEDNLKITLNYWEEFLLKCA